MNRRAAEKAIKQHDLFKKWKNSSKYVQIQSKKYYDFMKKYKKLLDTIYIE